LSNDKLRLYHLNEQQLKWIDIDKDIPIGWEPVPSGTLNNDVNPLKMPIYNWEIEVDFGT
jgi:hypothetical protein